MKWFIIVTVTSVCLLHGVLSSCGDKAFHCSHRLYVFHSLNMSTCHSDSPCKCNHVTVDCSFRNLSFVPFIGREIYRYLNFSGNRLRNISDASFFTNVSREVEMIDLFSNGLVYLSPAAFQGLTKLSELLLGDRNYLTYKDLPTLLSIRHGVSLDLSCLRLGHMPLDVFHNASKSKTTEIDFSWNQIPSLNMSAFQPLKRIQYLHFRHNEIYDLETAYLPTLQWLSLKFNRLFIFPKTCLASGMSMFPSLKTLKLDRNMIDCIDDAVCLPNLTLLSLNFNRILWFPSSMFSTARFPSLTNLELIQMEGKIQKIQPFFINNSMVQITLFQFNHVDFSAPEIHEDAFGGCTNLQKLFLRGNTFRQVPESRFHHLLSPLRESLIYLNLGQAQIKQVSDKMFSGLQNLRTLALYKNALFGIPDGVFDNLPSLTGLQVDHNYITTITETTFSPQLQNSFKHLYLSGNPFHCSCDILWFQHWVKTNPSIFTDKHATAGYTCANLNNIALPDFFLNEQACMLGSDAAAFTISITCVFILFFLLFSLFFRFRWHIRLWLYEACRSRQHPRLREQTRYKYDVFVSYAEENMGWVEHELIPVLEGECGLKLCVHQRDFVPGKHIVDNISDCVEDSYRILLIFSPSFARSEWCQFELKFCQTCVMERDDVLVIVALQAVGSRDRTGAMMAVLRTTTYVEWEDREEGRASFWERLRLALEDTEGLV